MPFGKEKTNSAKIKEWTLLFLLHNNPYHISFFPTPSGIDSAGDEAEKYRTGKGTMQFSYKEKAPLSLIKKIVKLRVAQLGSN